MCEVYKRLKESIGGKGDRYLEINGLCDSMASNNNNHNSGKNSPPRELPTFGVINTSFGGFYHLYCGCAPASSVSNHL